MTTAIIERVEPTNIVEVTHPTYVIAAEGADAFATGVLQAREAARAAALSAATAESAAGPTYPDTAAGLAATSDGEAFAVDNGDGTVTVWLNDGGVAVEQRTLATTDALASTDPGEGAAMVGLEQGGTVQQAIKYITPQMLGAAADFDPDLETGTDDTSAVQSAYNLAKSLGWTLRIPQGNYRITSGLTFDGEITVMSEGASFFYDDNSPGIALDIIAPATQLLRRPRILGHLVIEKVTADWAVACHGVRIQNAYMGEFHISVLKFNRGVWLHANQTGCVYNQIYLNQLTNNKYSTYLSNETSLGWCNQNTFWNGRYSNGINDAGCHIEIDDSLYQLNGNSWQNPSLEASFAPYSLFNLLGSQNSIIGGRFEHGGAPAKYGVLGGTKNTIDAHSAPYLTRSRVDITGTLYRLLTSVGSSWAYQDSFMLERQGDGPVLSLRGTTHQVGLEILTPAGARAVHIPANAAWEVFNGKKVMWRSTAAPATGTWSRGDIAFMTNPSAGAPAGWICTAAGTPGTWEPFGQMGVISSVGSAPDFVGQFAVNSGIGYMATGTASAADWKQITA